jgi:hypothetical protein
MEHLILLFIKDLKLLIYHKKLNINMATYITMTLQFLNNPKSSR